MRAALFGRRRADAPRRRLARLFFLSRFGRAPAGQRLDAAHAGRDRASAETEKPDIAGAADMGAAAQLDGQLFAFRLRGFLAHGDDANFVAVFFAEQGHGAGLQALSGAIRRVDRRVLRRSSLTMLDLRQFVRRRTVGMEEIKAQPFGRDQRALLRDVIAEQRAAPRAADGWPNGWRGSRRGAHDRPSAPRRRRLRARPCATLTRWTYRSPSFFCVSGTATRRLGRTSADVAGLAAGFGIERRLVEHQEAGSCRPELATAGRRGTSAVISPSAALGLVA